MKPTVQFRWFIARNPTPTQAEVVAYGGSEGISLMEANRRLLDEKQPALQQLWTNGITAGEWRNVPVEYGHNAEMTMSQAEVDRLAIGRMDAKRISENLDSYAQLMTEASEALEKIPHALFETLGIRSPLCDELDGSAGMARDDAAAIAKPDNAPLTRRPRP